MFIMRALALSSRFWSRIMIDTLGCSGVTSTNHASSIRLCSSLMQSVEPTKRPKRVFVSENNQLEKPLITTLSAIAETSHVLQQLVDMGVELHNFKVDTELCKFFLRADFDRDIRPYLQFLEMNGVCQNDLSTFISRNPYIFQCDLDDLQVRINYLESKKFTKQMIAEIITKNPKWLLYEVKFVDNRLGFIQKSLDLTGDEVRQLAVKFPRILQVKKNILQLNLFTIKEELLLEGPDIKKVVLNEANILRLDNSDLIQTFDYLLKVMSISHHLIIEQPKVLVCRRHILAIRHEFLLKLGRAQYNPKLPGYVSLIDLISKKDDEFCADIARTTLIMFYEFLKTR